MKISASDVFAHAQNGKHGQRVFLDFGPNDGGFCAQYAFETHDLDDAQIVAKHDEIVSYHAAKCARLRTMSRLPGAVVGGGYSIIDCTIWEKGEGCILLVLRLALGGKLDGEIITADRQFPTIAQLPSDAEILQIAKDAAAVRASLADAASEHAKRISTLLKMEGLSRD
jgi:hypothetical protein